jgi:hypothetical protein
MDFLGGLTLFYKREMRDRVPHLVWYTWVVPG